MKERYTLKSKFLLGVNCMMMNDEEPIVMNYTHVTCILIETVVLWKGVRQIAPIFTVLFALHLILLFAVGYAGQMAIERKQQEQKQLSEENFDKIIMPYVRFYQVVELIILLVGCIVHFKVMLAHMILSYFMPYQHTKFTNTFLELCSFSYFLKVLSTICLYITMWLPCFTFIFVLTSLEPNIVVRIIATIIYMFVIPFVISFEDDVGSLFEIAFNHMVY